MRDGTDENRDGRIDETADGGGRMRVVSRADAPALSRGDGLVSRILHPDPDDSDSDLTVTWVDVDPGAAQVPHAHDPEQVYVLVAGSGVMTVGADRQPVSAGDLVHIPSNTEHAIENTGETVLEYVSVATPAFPTEDVETFYEE